MGKGKNVVPDRWEAYSKKGTVISGTRFVSFKVPLKANILAKLPPEVDRDWSPNDLINSFDLGLVIDLTFTNRYYDFKVLENAGVKYVKIMTVGREIPKKLVVDTFFEAVDSFLKEDGSRLIGVHCTHGLNRTGYLVCRYMIERLAFEPEEAIKMFNEARGHEQERENYLQHLREKGWEKSPKKEGEKPDRGHSSRDQQNRREWKNRKRDKPRSDISDRGFYKESRSSQYRDYRNSDTWRMGPGESSQYTDYRNSDTWRMGPGGRGYGYDVRGSQYRGHQANNAANYGQYSSYDVADLQYPSYMYNMYSNDWGYNGDVGRRPFRGGGSRGKRDQGRDSRSSRRNADYSY